MMGKDFSVKGFEEEERRWKVARITNNKDG